MKAIVYNKKALPGKLVYCDVEKPIPNDNEVLVKIIAVSVNAADYRSIKMGLIPKKKIFGADIAGIVESVGNNIQQFKSILFGWVMSFGSKKIRFLAAKQNVKDLEFIVSLANDGKIKSVTDRHYPLDKAAVAIRNFSEGHARGKVVINVQ